MSAPSWPTTPRSQLCIGSAARWPAEYKGADAIKGVWTKFTGTMAPLTVKTTGEHAMDKNTLMAETAFTNKAGKTIAVELTEMTKEGKIKEETWKVNAPAAASSPAKSN